jgi:hypothetical protein
VDLVEEEIFEIETFEEMLAIREMAHRYGMTEIEK